VFKENYEEFIGALRGLKHDKSNLDYIMRVLSDIGNAKDRKEIINLSDAKGQSSAFFAVKSCNIFILNFSR
jgi:hypothetical protein